jgi:hypothetical protein
MGLLLAKSGRLGSSHKDWFSFWGPRHNANNFFQIACVDTGVVRTVNANCVTAIVERPVGGPVRV